MDGRRLTVQVHVLYHKLDEIVVETTATAAGAGTVSGEADNCTGKRDAAHGVTGETAVGNSIGDVNKLVGDPSMLLVVEPSILLEGDPSMLGVFALAWVRMCDLRLVDWAKRLLHPSNGHT